MDDFEKVLKFSFLEEAEQMLSGCEQSFLLLEGAPDDSSIIDKIFRLAHSFKGSAGVAGFEDLSSFAHHLESLLEKIKSGRHKVDKATVNLLLRANDELNSMVCSLRADLNRRFTIEPFIADIQAVLNSTQMAAQAAVADEPQISLSHDAEKSADSGFHLFADSSPTPAPASKPPVSGKDSPPASPNTVALDESIRVNLRRIDELVNDVGELVILQTVLYEHRHLVPSDLLQKTISHLEKITRKIQDSSMSLRMVPLSQTFQKMQRIVRDTSQLLDKKMRLKTFGDDTEIDKTVLDLLSDPLVHLVRNAVDHGIESAADREASGKPAEGTVTLKAYHLGEHIVVEISDDGRGLDKDKLISKAERLGLINPGSVRTEQEAYQLIFKSGFSTKEAVTSISGRGVGMDVVKTNVEQIHGRIEVESTLGKGSCFRILLPLTLAIIDGMVVATGDQRYVIPITAIQESLLPGPDDITFAAQRGHYLNVRGQTIPLFRLSQILGQKPAADQAMNGIAVVGKGKGGVSFAVLVDDIISQQQIVIKRLGDELHGLAGLSGAAILGDGKAALIIDFAELINATKSNKSVRKEAA